MEYLRIRPVSEADFDSIVEAAGGTRIPDEGSADYILKEAVIELKFIQEEGFEKETRREAPKRILTLKRNLCWHFPLTVRAT